jgi:16S rRNA G966 N2-methylase RsmD
MDINIILKIFPHRDHMENNYQLLKYDNIGLYSISLPSDADKISQIIEKELGNNKIIFDGTAGLGGNTISFSKYFKYVISIEMDKDRFNLLENNIKTYKLNNIVLINDNCLNYLDENCDGYFFDPPWGGPDYKYNFKLRLKLGNLELGKIIGLIKNTNNKRVFFKLPLNYDLDEFSNYNYKTYKINNYLIVVIY